MESLPSGVGAYGCFGQVFTNLWTYTIFLSEMQNTVIIPSQTVDVYKEKVARQEIGVLTAPCKIPYVQKMVSPARPEEPNIEYERIPISYNSLDLIGHGVWDRTKTVRVCSVITSNCVDINV